MIQTKDSNLTFRPLTIDDAEQYNALLRYAFQVTEQELSESGWKDDEIKQKQLEEQVKDRYFKVGIAAAELMIPLMFYGIWMNKGFKFEETGTITSSTFKGLINRFRPTKK